MIIVDQQERGSCNMERVMFFKEAADKTSV
jgi:hypothetical protein